MSMPRFLLLAFAVAFCVTTAKAQTADTQSLNQRVEQLEHRVAELERRLQAFEASPQRPQLGASGAASGDWKQLANWRRLKTGMSMDEVRALLGEPDRVDVIVYPVWSYGGRSANVTFDPRSQKVNGWSEPRSERY